MERKSHTKPLIIGVHNARADIAGLSAFSCVLTVVSGFNMKSG